MSDEKTEPTTLEQENPENLPVVKESPDAVVEFGQNAAKKLIDIVESQGLSKAFRQGAKPHIFYEGWATVAKFYGCTIEAEDAEPVGDLDSKGQFAGFKAKARVVTHEGQTVGAATAYCMRDERNWKGKENYALASMAQTRAGSKAARMVFSWVVVLAGYSATPAEEMDGLSGNSEPEQGVPGAKKSDPTPVYAPRETVEQWIAKNLGEGEKPKKAFKLWAASFGKVGKNQWGHLTIDKVDPVFCQRLLNNPDDAVENFTRWYDIEQAKENVKEVFGNEATEIEEGKAA